jgi:hypothetical protein
MMNNIADPPQRANDKRWVLRLPFPAFAERGRDAVVEALCFMTHSSPQIAENVDSGCFAAGKLQPVVVAVADLTRRDLSPRG